MEQALKTIEQRLIAATQRATTAESQVTKLHLDLASAQQQLMEARAQAAAATAAAAAANAASAGGAGGGQSAFNFSNVGMGNLTLEQQQQIALVAQSLDQAGKKAQENIKQLVNGANQLGNLALMLQNLGRISETNK